MADEDAYGITTLTEATEPYMDSVLEGFQPDEGLAPLAWAMDGAISLSRCCSEMETRELLAEWAVVCDKIASQPGGQSFLDMM
jgi:hypothetical protein